MKKIVFITILISTLFMKYSFAISESFQKIISTLNVPDKNIDGYEINEEIYNKYNLIVYGTPKDVINKQRWKDVPEGKIKNETTGAQGEYRILGYSVTGTVVNNESFPDDYVSGKSPEEWNYIYIKCQFSSILSH